MGHPNDGTTRGLCVTTWTQAWRAADDAKGIPMNAAAFAGLLIAIMGSARGALEVVPKGDTPFAIVVRSHLLVILLEEEAAAEERKVAS